MSAPTATPSRPLATNAAETFDAKGRQAGELSLSPSLQAFAEQAERLPTDELIVNMGPSHPAMHGTVRVVLRIDGETIKDADVQVGYLHRGFEKESESATYTQIFPYVDRLNYVSPMLNNVGFAMAVEKLLGITAQIPERAEYIRVIVGELSRVADHLTCITASLAELGGLTAFFWGNRAREHIWELLEDVSGARMTHSYCRIGGVAWDLTADFEDKCRGKLVKIRGLIGDIRKLVERNRIFLDRMQGVGIISAEDAISYGITGPNLRGSGVDYDVRKDQPYSVYEHFDFDVPVSDGCDNLARYLVRIEEMEQSMRIIEQALVQIPPGAVIVDDPLIALPAKREVYNSIEGMIAHFKHIMDGLRVPPGEAYSFTEGGNGELGFYIVSDGTGRPYKNRCRPPCFYATAALRQMILGANIADVVPIFGSINMIGGECDR
ncbi:MAG: NADH-quinone oxidoreductase subunit D [Deltaproteobacteria bacterium]|nr:NADH-quinone oxidoreductase subunit D [Deltaproteobacteria bacterium]MBK8238128.1 NADH-quinone oxidoreductase subunit D [Deltaproteobacteria bacterium]MBK8718528.1 NADH-quinone oxidoreductase subunit D [Deltaproteobacteria bacterium]MBP7288590.1 NADH-quinone oxidoreductase subunit D [Nannocystaceae bacterium]